MAEKKASGIKKVSKIILGLVFIVLGFTAAIRLSENLLTVIKRNVRVAVRPLGRHVWGCGQLA